jgi:tetratricopeptide (TPR) repeat protein
VSPHDPDSRGAPGPGSVLGRYTLGERLGTGASATVFRAQADDGRVVAVKVLQSGLPPDDLRRFQREYATLVRLDHPNVLRVYEASLDATPPWIAMECVDGSDLGDLVAGWEAPPAAARMASVEALLRDLCAALAYVHDEGLVHRDLKPQNVLIDPDGRAHLSDFGVVKDPDAGTAVTQAGRLVGTVAFMAPEQITSDTVDARTDLYALGAVLYYLCTGKRPIEAPTVAGYLARHLTEVPKPPSFVNPAVPGRLDRICARLLAKAPADRFPSATAVLEALDADPEDVRPPLRGRDALLGEVRARIRALGDGKSAVWSWIGPPGVGRTRLLEAARELAQEEGVRLDDEGDGPVVLTVDDADQRPTADLDAVKERALRASRGGPPVLAILGAATRSLTLGPWLESVSVPTPVEPIRPLGREDVVALIRDLGVVGPAAPILGRRLHTELGGLPAPIVVQVRALLAAGWLDGPPGRLRAVRSLDDLRTGELPVPPDVAAQLRRSAAGLGPRGRAAAELLAVFGAPTSRDLLVASVGPGGDDAVHELIVRGVALSGTEDDVEKVRFTHPAAGAVLRADLSDAGRRERAGAAARAVGRQRRRADAALLARLLRLSGDDAAAYPALVRAARRAAREGRFVEVIATVAEARTLEGVAEPSLDAAERVHLKRWLYLLEGEAQLGRARWVEAIAPLEQAVAVARIEGDAAALGRSLAALGRARYRAGRLTEARGPLEEARRTLDPTDPARAAATRALGDILLRDGAVDAADALWTEALGAARTASNPEAEARGLRGLAHVRALQGRLDAAASLLDAAQDGLDRGGDAHVKGGVLSRLVELDLCAGRLGSALHRSERLLELVQQQELVERIADAWALRGVVLLEIGRPDPAKDAVRTSLSYADVQGPSSWNARLRAARILASTGDLDGARAALPSAEALPPSPVDDPPGQLAALRARLAAPTDPANARDLASWALSRPPPMLVLRALRVLMDASRALARVGDVEAARDAAKRGLRLLDGPGTDGFRLDALLALHQAAPDPRVAEAARLLVDRIALGLPAAIVALYRARPDLARLSG